MAPAAFRPWLAALALLACSTSASAQTFSQRGFAEGTAWLFPQSTANDRTHLVGDVLVRDDLFYKPRPWFQAAAGLDLRANSHDQVDARWRIDVADRGDRRPLLSLRRLSATLTRGRFTVEAGKQVVRWGKTDIVTPTDRFAPRDFLNVVDGEFLAVRGVRAAAQFEDNAVEVVWTPVFTPSRTPLVSQRWTIVPPGVEFVATVDGGAVFPSGSQTGARWSHVGQALEYSLAFFDGFNHAPTILSAFRQIPPAIALTRVYPPIRMYGADLAMPGRWFTLKAETAYVTSTSPVADEYVLYVIQLERQRGEWLFVGGYAGEALTRAGTAPSFAPDRGLSRAFIGRASYTIGPTRGLVFEGAVRRTGHGAYGKAEYSEARGQHWRVTVTVRVLGGDASDFLGQYGRNSHAAVAVRYSF